MRCDRSAIRGPARAVIRPHAHRARPRGRAGRGGAAGGCRCVTLHGELLETDGTLTVGEHHAGAGILSRKSELRELARTTRAYSTCAWPNWMRDLAELRERIAALDDRIGRQQLEIDVLADQSADLRERIGQRRQRREGSARRGHSESVGDQRAGTGNRDVGRVMAAGVRRSGQGRARTSSHCNPGWKRPSATSAKATVCGCRRQHDATAAKVALAQVDERLSGIPGSPRTIRDRTCASERERLQAEQQLEDCRQREDENQQTLLQTSSALACVVFTKRGGGRRRWPTQTGERDRVRQEKNRRTEEAQTNRGGWRERQEQIHVRELAVNDLRHRRDALCDRLREDYQLELADAYEQQMGNGEWGMGNEKQIDDAAFPIPHSPFPILIERPRRKKSPNCAANSADSAASTSTRFRN